MSGTQASSAGQGVLDSRYIKKGGDTVSGNYTFSGHLTVEGVTATGATGTGKFVFDTSPTITTPTIAGNLAVSAGYTYDLGSAGTPWNNGWFGFSVNIQNAGINTEIVAGANGTNQILTLPLGTDTIVARASTDTLTNKTLGTHTISDGANVVLGTTTGSQIGTATNQKLGFFGKTPVVQQTQGATLTNNITSGGSANTLANYTSLTTYSTDAAAIRNNLYQLGQTLKTVVDALRTFGLLS